VKVVIALGGNALAPPGLEQAETQRAAARHAAEAIAGIAREHDVVVTHGNGPQVGLLAAQAEAAGQGVPLDVLGAESEGLIGYLLEQELANALPGRDVAALLTQVEVAPDDPAFAHPTKPIGALLDAAGAERLRARGLAVGPDRGGFRRLVASPAPREIVELRTIQLLVRIGVVVVCSGGGGIPVVRDGRGAHHGASAVIDKDRSAVLLGTGIAAGALLLLTDVPAVYADWPETKQAIRRASPRALAARAFAPGTMGPKVESACRFVRGTGGFACIGAVGDAERLLGGEAGTRIESEAPGLELWEPPR
jgi:carbamate kinase